MKKWAAVALAAQAVAGGALAQSTVAIGGRVDVGPQYVNDGVNKLKRVDSGTYTASRLFFKGTEDLGGGLSAGFYLENRFNADTGAPQNATKFFNAGSQVFLESSALGSVTLGRQYSPIFWSFLWADDTGPLRLHSYSAVNSIQRSNTARLTAAASPIKAAGSLDTIAGGVYQLGIATTFEDNMVLYKTPTVGGVVARLAVSAPEGSPAGSGRVLAGNAEYRGGPLFASVAYNQKRGTVPAGGGPYQKLTEELVSGLYEVVPSTFKLWGNFHPWKLSDPAAQLKGRDWMVGASYWLPSSMVWVNYADKNISNCVSCNSKGFGVGYHYFLSKRSEVYASAAQVSSDANAGNTLNGLTPGAFGKKMTGYAVGVATTF
jgi:predicted porin